jgi:IS4 transposase
VDKKKGHEAFKIENGGEIILPYDEVYDQARQTGFSKRLRKLHPVLFILTLLTHRSAHTRPTIRDLWHAYMKMAFPDGITPKDFLTYQSFYERFTEELPLFLQNLLISAMTRMEQKTCLKLEGKYAKFNAIYLIDSTIIRIHEKLAKMFPAVRTRIPGKSAGKKLFLIYNAVVHGPSSISLIPERTSDIRILKIGSWVKGSLMIMDLGLYKHWNFAKIAENGGYFIVRLKSLAKPLVKKIIIPDSNVDYSQYIGRPVSEVLPYLPRGPVAMQVSVSFLRRKYRKKTGKEDSIDFFCVAEYNPIAERWHTYLTNLSLKEFSVREICALYAFRWTIELLFKEMKSDNELGQLKSVNDNLTESLILVSILRTMVSRSVSMLASKYRSEEEENQLHPLLWSRIYKEHTADIARILKKEHASGTWFNEEWEELIRYLAGFSIPIKRVPSRMIQPVSY